MRTRVRHKHVRLDQTKLDRAKEILGASTETETLERALDLVLTEVEIEKALKGARRNARLRRVFD